MKFFPTLVTATVIFSIGLSLYSVAIGYIAGGKGSPDFGSPLNWLVALITLGVVIFCNYYSKGTLKLVSFSLSLIVFYHN